MVELITSGFDDRVFALIVRGSIDRPDLDAVSAAFEAKLKQHKPVRLYAEIQDLAGISPQALLEDLRLSLQHFRDVERAAVVVDEAWLAALAQVGGLLPGIDVRQYTWPEREKAREWIMG